MIRTKIFTFFSIFIVGVTANLFAAAPKAVLTLRAEPEYFSPNNDGLQDQVFLYPGLQAESEARTWRLDITDAQ